MPTPEQAAAPTEGQVPAQAAAPAQAAVPTQEPGAESAPAPAEAPVPAQAPAPAHVVTSGQIQEPRPEADPASTELPEANSGLLTADPVLLTGVPADQAPAPLTGADEAQRGTAQLNGSASATASLNGLDGHLDQLADSSQAPPVGRRRRATKRRLPTQRIFSDLAAQAAIPASSYAIGEDVDGAMCLVKTDEGFEVFNSAAGARHEVRVFDDEESAYFYLFGVLVAEAVRTGALAPRQ